MTTQRQIRKLMKPVLERHHDLELVGQWLYLRPVHHLARAVLIDRTASADYFKVRWAIINLCQPWEFFPLDWGNMIWPKKSLWLWDDPEMPEAFYDKLETEALPALRKTETLKQFHAFACNPDNFESRPRLLDDQRMPLEKTIMDAAIGDFGLALKGCVKLITTKNWYQDPEWKMEYNGVTMQLYPLLQAGDRKGVAQLLREWEAFTAEHFGITHIWEPAPFPFEEE